MTIGLEETVPVPVKLGKGVPGITTEAEITDLCDPKIKEVGMAEELGLTADMFRKIEEPIYGRLVPKRIEETILKETYMVMDARVGEIEGMMA